MIKPDKLQKAFEKVEEENWALRAFLKEQDPDEVDDIVHNLHKELFKDCDCIACSNCCKASGTIVNQADIKNISAKLNLSVSEFKKEYLVKTDEGFMISKEPCPFLSDNGCKIYECRPKCCKEYPYTDKEEISTRLINLVENCAVCPVVFEIFERLKNHFGNEFQQYKEEYEEMWGEEGDYNEEYDVEEWEAEEELFDEEDWEGLVEYRRQKAEKYPNDPEYQWGLGEAYVLNKEYDKAIELLSELHTKEPDNPNVQHTLLDALYKAGKDETAIDWIVKPRILQLDKDVLEECYNNIKTARKVRTVYELHLDLSTEGYPRFNEKQLADYLCSDNRFVVTGNTDTSYDCFVRLNKIGRNDPCFCGSGKKYKKCCGGNG